MDRDTEALGLEFHGIFASFRLCVKTVELTALNTPINSIGILVISWCLCVLVVVTWAGGRALCLLCASVPWREIGLECGLPVWDLED